MATKKKKETTKKVSVPVEKETAENLTKEDIKEMVEETVEEVLKEQGKNQPTVSEEKDIDATEEVEVPSEKEPVVETKEEAVPNSFEPTTIESSTPSVVSAEEKPVEPSTPAEQPVDAAKQETVLSSPTISANGASPTTLSSAPVLSENKVKNKKSPLLLLFIIFVICGFVIGISVLYLLYRNNLKLPTIQSLVKQAPVVKSLPTVTPTPKSVSIATYNIIVLNGSGVAGAAAQAKRTLTSAGFTVVSTGNATKNTTDTTVAAKSTVDQNALAKLLQTLAAKYTVSSHTLPLSASESADVVVTIGGLK